MTATNNISSVIRNEHGQPVGIIVRYPIQVGDSVYIDGQLYYASNVDWQKEQLPSGETLRFADVKTMADKITEELAVRMTEGS